jgi:hypothetical protein
MGAIGSSAEESPDTSIQAPLPYFSAEIGGGLQNTYHRRLVVHPDDIAAMFPVMLGSGVNLYGTYMFQGGENPGGKLSTLQESQATGYPNDVPVKSYDFQAPLGEFGEERDSFRKMKVFQYFLNDFGEYLAPMMVHAPDRQPANPGDFSVPRAAVRSRGDSGFIFFNNYVRNYQMPARTAAQFEIRLPHGTLKVPSRPVDLPSGAYFIWPFNLHAGGTNIRYSTAQPFTRLASAEGDTYYFAAIPGVPVEFAFESGTLRALQTSSGEAKREEDATVVAGVEPGIDSFIDVTASNGKRTRIVVLTDREADNAWKVRLAGDSAGSPARDHLLITAQDFFADLDGGPRRIWLRSRGSVQFAFSITPPVATAPRGSLAVVQTGASPQAVRFAAEADEQKLKLGYTKEQAGGDAPPVTLGVPPAWRSRGVAQAPGETTPAYAARWSISLPANSFEGLSELYLQVSYCGDLARLNKGGTLLTDNFYNGQPWSIGLRRFMKSEGNNTFELNVLPLRRDAPVYFELPSQTEFGLNGQIDTLEQLRLVPEYQLVLTDGGAQ